MRPIVPELEAARQFSAETTYLRTHVGDREEPNFVDFTSQLTLCLFDKSNKSDNLNTKLLNYALCTGEWKISKRRSTDFFKNCEGFEETRAFEIRNGRTWTNSVVWQFKNVAQMQSISDRPSKCRNGWDFFDARTQTTGQTGPGPARPWSIDLFICRKNLVGSFTFLSWPKSLIWLSKLSELIKQKTYAQIVRQRSEHFWSCGTIETFAESYCS